MSRLVRSLLATLAMLLLAACGGPSETGAPRVLAAASLQEALGAAARAWAEKGHSAPVISFASSAALARQIENGAPADLFVSADEEWMDYIARRGLIAPGTRVVLATNRIVLIAPQGSTLSVRAEPGMPLARLLAGGKLAMADPDAVPAGKYGAEALAKLGVWDSVRQQLARAENVRAALALVERGAAPLGIVYATDARASGKVVVVARFPARLHRPIVYPLARLAAAKSTSADDFRRFLVSPEGQAIFARFGFGGEGGA